MSILENLKTRWKGTETPFLIHPNGKLYFKEISNQKTVDLSNISSGDVVALIGDFDPISILTLLKLLDKNVILVPLTKQTRPQHKYFFESSFFDYVIEGNSIYHIKHKKNISY